MLFIDKLASNKAYVREKKACEANMNEKMRLKLTKAKKP